MNGFTLFLIVLHYHPLFYEINEKKIFWLVVFHTIILLNDEFSAWDYKVKSSWVEEVNLE